MKISWQRVLVAVGLIVYFVALWFIFWGWDTMVGRTE